MKALIILGYWNCGTTLLTELLAGHPDIKLRNARWLPNLEERYTRKILPRILKKRGQTIVDEWSYYREPILTDQEMAYFRTRFLRKFNVRDTKTLLIKNPWLLWCRDLLDRTFEGHNVDYAFILRDARSQVPSKDYWRKGTRTEEEAEQKLYHRSRFWAENMDYFFSQWYGRDDVHVMRYENLCHDTRNTVETLCSFANLDSTPLLPNLPRDLSVRLSKWKALPDPYRAGINEIVGPVQQRIDTLFPTTQELR